MKSKNLTNEEFIALEKAAGIAGTREYFTADGRRQLKSAIKKLTPGYSDENHEECLRTASVVLNHYQDIEDVLDDNDLTHEEKLKRIKKLNGQIGKTVAKYLPG